MKLNKINWLLSGASGLCFADGESLVGGAVAPPIPDAPAAPATVGESLYPDGGSNPEGTKPAEPSPGSQAPEGDKPTEAPKDESKPEGDKPAEPPVALKAEDYKFDLPEGVTLNADSEKALRETLAGMGANQENASALMKMHIDALTAQSEALTRAAQENFTNLRAEWRKEIDAMPEFQGTQRETSLALLARGIEEFAPAGKVKDVKDMFDSSGMGDNPLLTGLILNMAKALAEGGPTPTGRPGTRGGEQRSKPTTLGQALYGDSPQQ